jgi:hypothetical protein
LSLFGSRPGDFDAVFIRKRVKRLQIGAVSHQLTVRRLSIAEIGAQIALRELGFAESNLIATTQTHIATGRRALSIIFGKFCFAILPC